MTLPDELGVLFTLQHYITLPTLDLPVRHSWHFWGILLMRIAPLLVLNGIAVYDLVMLGKDVGELFTTVTGGLCDIRQSVNRKGFINPLSESSFNRQQMLLRLVKEDTRILALNSFPMDRTFVTLVFTTLLANVTVLYQFKQLEETLQLN
ncbi:hypothetical protein DMENIID0001_114050 [Sergentomyia squamirostris]